MKKIKYIKNITNEIKNVNGFEIYSGVTVDVSGNSQILSKDGYYNLTEFEIKGELEFYDEDNIIMSDSEFYDHFNLMQNHILKNSGNSYKIYDYLSEYDIKQKNVNTEIPPLTLDYKKGLKSTLYPKYTFNQGFLVEVEYFSDSYLVATPYAGVSAATYVNPVLKIEAEYHVGGNGYVSHRKVSRTWQKTDNTYDYENQKITIKFYNNLQSRAEGVRRRTNIVDEIVSNTGGLILMTQSGVSTVQEAEAVALPFLNYTEDPINKYIKGNLNPLLETVLSANTETFPWLLNYIDTGGTTIQQYVYGSLSLSLQADGIYS